jgi:DNA-binding transcriptional MocR family regulator
MSNNFAHRMQYTQPSDIREILLKTSEGGYISFAGGIPDPELFPVELLNELAQKVLHDHSARALQYGPTPGLLPLREQIAALMSNIGVAADIDHIQITSGAQQGISLSGTIFVNPGDIIITERPTYSAAINALDLFRPCYKDVESDEEGPDVEQVRGCVHTEQPVKFAYVIPNFQNPSGRLWSSKRRVAFMDALAGSETLIIEDDPYGQLAFGDQPPQPLKAIDEDERVIYLGSFSKVLCPGLRVGWIVASPEILAKYNLAKQFNDLHTSSFDQELINAYLEDAALQPQIDRLRETYASRCTAMLSALDETFPADVYFTRPEGGLFIWVELPKRINSRDLLELAMQEKVAFIPGDGFFATRPMSNTLRLNFSAMGPEKIKEGIAILGRIVHELIDQNENLTVGK